jgi:hypothetical protein
MDPILIIIGESDARNFTTEAILLQIYLSMSNSSYIDGWILKILWLVYRVIE